MISTNYNNANNLMSKALERLSTGKQLNKAADNAARDKENQEKGRLLKLIT